MSFTERNNLSAADVAAVMGSNGGFGFGDSSFYLLILFLFAFGGNNGWGFGGGNGTNNEIQRGFDQQSVMAELNGLNTSVATGFANAEVSRCNSQANILQALNTNQMATTSELNSLAMNLQNCCCENRSQVADLKYTIATESAATRANDQANTQLIMDKLCQLELDGVKQRNADLLAENNTLKFVQSQTDQTAQILANNAAQTQALEQYLNPAPIPAYVVQNPNGCSSGCGFNAVV